MKYPFYIRKFWCLYLLVGMIAIAVTVGADRAVTTIAENTPIEREQIIVIDAGHGGEDGGAVSCSGALESHINLQIALRLNDLLHLLGYETIMIRSTDISVYTEGSTIAARKVSDLKQRVRTVNQTKNAILISIHQNTFPDGKYSGAQVFYNQNVSAKELAERMQQTFVSHLNIGSNRKSKQVNGVYLLQHITQPGILVECGFLSNWQEESLLRDAQYQRKVCCVIASSLCSYLST